MFSEVSCLISLSVQSTQFLVYVVVNYFADICQTLKTTLGSAGHNILTEHVHTHIRIEHVGVAHMDRRVSPWSGSCFSEAEASRHKMYKFIWIKI